MRALRRTAVVAALVVTGLLFLSGFAASGGSGATARASALSTAAGGASTTPAMTAPVAQRVSAELAAAHVPQSEVFLPNFDANVPVTHGVVSPLYAEAPAPMGLGDFGVQDVNGSNVGTVTYTSSVEGVLQMDGLNSTYLDGQGPDSVSIQLNTVLTNVQLFGQTGYQFWIQNVPEYIPHLGQLSLLDNVWNFSSPAFDMTQNSIYSARGFVVAPVFYYANGPTFHVAPPFTIRVYNNATIVHDRPAVYLNYSLTTSNGVTVSGSYDRVVFNSSVAAHPKVAAVPPTFQIDGKHLGATRFLPNDAELMLGGSDDGDTTSISTVAGTMQLLVLPNGTGAYRSVKSAYNFGTDTGETTEGMSVWGTGGAVPTAHLTAGPSFLYPLWGVVGGQLGHVDQTLTVAPSNAFVFVSPGSRFDAGTAQWAFVPPSGTVQFQLPPGTYSYRVLLSEYAPVSFSLSGAGATSVALRSDPSLGVYTPLWAWNNAQLAAISNPGGRGTVAHPYVLFNRPGTINALFGEMNDFFFPVFPGVLLYYTGAYVTITNSPSFLVQYSLPGQVALLAASGLPSFNYLQFEFENASNVSMVDNPILSGWFSASNIGMSLGDVLFWNSSHDLVASNQFEDMGVAVYVAFGADDVFWGNTFTAAVPPCADPLGLLNYSDQVGLQLSADGDLVYNNVFDVPLGGVTPTYAPATYLFASFHDRWNVTPQPATDVRHMNGFALSGNILGQKTEGGNYWENYGSPSDPYGRLPFNDAEQITRGGDDAPILPFTLHVVRFDATGLPAGTSWSVTFGGVTESSRSASVLFWDPVGTYAYVVGPVVGYSASPASGAVTVPTGPTVVAITWT